MPGENIPMQLLYQKLNKLRTQDLIIQKMRYRRSTRLVGSLKTMAYAASALMAGHLFQTFADGLELTSFDAIALVLVMWLLAIIFMLEVEMANDLAGHELIQDLLDLRSQRLNLTGSKRSVPMTRGKQ